MRTWNVVGALALLAFAENVAHAQPAQDEALGRALFTEARTLMNEGKYAEACPKLEEGQRVSPGVGMKFNLADCYEKVGRTASAWAAFLDAAASARLLGQAEREKAARDRAEVLERTLSKLKVEVPAESMVEGLEVTRDGTPVGRGAFGVEFPVDPGEHVVVAKAPGFTPWTGKARLGAESAKATLVVPKLVAVAVQPVEPPPRYVPLPPPAPVPPPSRTMTYMGLTSLGLGVAGLGAGAIFGLLAASSKSDSDPLCPQPNLCSPDGVRLRDQAIVRGNVSTIAFVAGGVLAAAGVTFLVLAPKRQAQVAATVAPTMGGALTSVQVTF